MAGYKPLKGLKSTKQPLKWVEEWDDRPTPRVEYSANNSGGGWWLKDWDWKNLEKAGWAVDWFDERLLDALAMHAYLPVSSYEEAIAQFERVTHLDASARGCDCCGSPHYFDLIEEADG